MPPNAQIPRLVFTSRPYRLAASNDLGELGMVTTGE
jgi:hypothetical protein